MSKGLRHLVTDHAVIRWLERVEGLNIESVRQHIIDHNVLTEMDLAEEPKWVKHYTGARVFVQGGRVVTVVGEELWNSKPKCG